MQADRRVQGLSALASGAIVVGMAAVLILGLRAGRVIERAESLVSIAFRETEPPPPPQPKRREDSRSPAPAPTGEPAPRNLRNQATQVVAPQPPVVLVPPPPIVTAPQANVGNAAQSGASDLPGPGQGAGGVGSGFGGGGTGGDGTGGSGDGGGGEPPVVGPRRIRGKLSYSDIPPGMLPEWHGEVGVEVLFSVNPNGRVSNCRPARSSGVPALDGLVCRLIEQRFVYRPARDRRGRPVRSTVIEMHSWVGRPNGG